jgi:Winged helix DNA-binding domain
MTVTLPPAAIPVLRLHSQRLLNRAPETPDSPVEAVRWMTAMQAQDLPGALYSTGLRAPGSTLSSVREALCSGEVVRSWPMRGTLHLMVAEDLGWVLRLTSARTVAGMAGRHRQLGISTSDVGQVRDVAEEVLSGGRAATREALLAAFAEAGQPTTGQRGVHLLALLSLDGFLVQGPLSEARQLFVLAADWIARPRDLAGKEALAELALRYFRARGPARLADFTWWSKLTVKDAKIGLAAAAPELERMVSDGVDHYLSPDTAALLTGKRDPAAGRLLLLPGFDEMMLGYGDRTASLDPAHAELVVPGKNGIFQPTIMVGGRVVGTWRRRGRSGTAPKPEPLPFAPLSAARQRAFDRAAEAYLRFIGSD